MVRLCFGGSSNGRTPLFGGGYLGSNPSPPVAFREVRVREPSVRLGCEHVFVPRIGPRYSEDEARQAIAASYSWAEALRRLGMCRSGNAWRILKKYAAIWGI